MDEKNKRFIKFVGINLLYGMFVAMFFYTFLPIYFSSSKEMLVSINIYGEAHLDLIAFLLVFVLGTWAIVLNWWEWCKK